jgi:membrane-associated phospholipid phosphatase
MKTRYMIVAACILCAALIPSPSSRADMVTDWNETAEVVIRASTPSPPIRIRALAIVNAAIYDAVNGIARTYQPYFVTDAAPPGARQEAAALQAAFTALMGLFPAQAGLLEEKLAESLASIPGHRGQSQSIARGRAWGEHVAQAVLAWRATDGLSTVVPPYFGGFDPGQWRSIPDGTVPGVLPQYAMLVPFTMSNSSQFRPGPQPALLSAQYAADVNEVKAIGRVDSAIRTATQTQLSLLWAAAGSLEENAVARSVVPRRYALADTARFFALINFAACDGMIAGFDAKYHYGFWRPFHAIRLADTDGNPATEPDPSWTSLIPAPNHPEYISTHSTVTAASMRVLALLLGNQTPFTLSSPDLPGVTVTYQSFSDAAVEVGLSRIWGGIHFRTACEVGRAVGESIADQAVTNYLLPR